MNAAAPPMADQPPPPIAPDSSRKLLNGVMIAVAVWGAVLALGAALFQPSANEGIVLHFRPWRGLLVLACVAAFLGSWRWLLARRQAAK